VHTRFNNNNIAFIVILIIIVKFFHVHAGFGRRLHIYCLVAILIFQTLVLHSSRIFLIGTSQSSAPSTHAQTYVHTHTHTYTYTYTYTHVHVHVHIRVFEDYRLSDYVHGVRGAAGQARSGPCMRPSGWNFRFY
jgi:hypothetical protein